MDLDTTLAAALAIALGTVLILALRALAGSDGVRLEDVLAPSFELGWPRGVQEADLVPWRVEKLPPRDDRAREERRAAGPAARRSTTALSTNRTGPTNI